MKLPRLSRLNQLKGLVILSGLGLMLVISQVSWSSAELITPQALVPQLGTPQAPLILDVRSEAEYQDGHIPGAINIPYREVPNRVSEIAEFTDREVVVYCEVGVRAGIAEAALEQAGFERIRHLEGDMRRWRQEDLPLETN